MSDYSIKKLDVDITDGISDNGMVAASLKQDSMPKSNSEITHVVDYNRDNNLPVPDYLDFQFGPFHKIFLRPETSTNDR